MHILVTSPIPSHPQNHGNRARVTALCQALQNQGAQIHYIYGGLENLPESQELAMRETWDHVYVLPPHKQEARKKSFKTHHAIDDWYTETVTERALKVLSTWKIDYCIANYVWFSKWLDHVPEGIPKYIDTHDVFGDRHKQLKADGLPVSWFHTSPKQEAIALKRADGIIAIQDQEAQVLRGRSNVPVQTLGHFIEPHFIAPSQHFKDGKVKVGYIASDNPINQKSLEMLATEIAKRPALNARYDFILAGAICNSDAADNAVFQKQGFVESMQDFYASVDVVVNPNIGGTGLKIKSVEAMAYGKALLATRDAMAGIACTQPYHDCKNVAALMDHLLNLTPQSDIPAAEAESIKLIKTYRDQQKAALKALFPKLFGNTAS
jgi:glycosyltransferase involved in cell wall biosynthesis